MKRYFAVLAIFVLFATLASAATITLTGTIRDFIPSNMPAGTYNGHPGTPHVDFQNWCCGFDPGITTSVLGLDGKPVYAGGASTHSAAAFDQWYRDTPGVNVSMLLPITLDDTGHPGLYTYNNSSFFPIDGQLFADDSGGHNYAFTYEIHTTFGYQSGQTFSFTGDDDVFVYINGLRVIDLGGVHAAASASVNLDTLGLTAGHNYNLDIFFAERHTVDSDFMMSTTIPLQTAPEPATMTLLALGGLGIWLRRRAQA